MTFVKQIRKVLLVFCLAGLLGACASNTVVPLRYQATIPQNGPTCTQSLTLMPFEDKRAETITIGSLGDGKRFYPETDVTEWVSWAMFEELKGRGCDVKYREKADTHAPKGFVVSGSFDNVNVESGTALMAKATLRVRVKVEKDGKWVMEQIYSGERENLGLTKVDAAQKVLSSTLQYLLKDAATDVVQAAK